MSYDATTIATTINKLNRTYFLPAIQRPFVWKTEQIVRLFDSLMKGYPISSFLFWDLQPENRGNWEIYKFAENFKYGEIHNETASTDGLDVSLVLDGQQRLTSLMIGLRGSYTVKQMHKRRNNPDAWVKKRLYLDLLQDPGVEEDGTGVEVSYGFSFFTEAPPNTKDHFWVKVGKILDFDNENSFDEYMDTLIESMPGEVTRAQERIFRRNLERLYRVIWKDEVISYYTEHNQSYDRVLDIFIRANDGGTKLSKSDLLLSMITSKWDGVNARDEIYNFLDYLNNDLLRKNDFDKDILMKACLILLDLPHVYKVSNFTTSNLNLIKSKWTDIKRAIEATVALVNSFGLDRDTLTSSNALLPIAYYIYKSGNQFDGTSSFEYENSEKIRRWLLLALLNNTFGGSSDNTIGQARTILSDITGQSTEFPMHALTHALRTHSKYSDLDVDLIEEILQTTYRQNTCFLALSLAQERDDYGTNVFHVDHIFPQSWFSTAQLHKAGISEGAIPTYQEYCNRIGNLQILLARENQEKSDMSFQDWIKSRDSSFKRRHCIPEDGSLYAFDKFISFVNARDELINTKIRSLLSFKMPGIDQLVKEGSNLVGKTVPG